MEFDRWLAKVEHELVRLGVDALEAKAEVDEHRDWFEDQFESGAYPEITGFEWFTHHR
ncbi:MAG TPA: hypothetical protein VGD46_11715 [Rhizobacter sp.]